MSNSKKEPRDLRYWWRYPFLGTSDLQVIFDDSDTGARKLIRAAGGGPLEGVGYCVDTSALVRYLHDKGMKLRIPRDELLALISPFEVLPGGKPAQRRARS